MVADPPVIGTVYDKTILDNIDNTAHIDKQNALLNSFNINIDGKAYKRIQEAMVKL